MVWNGKNNNFVLTSLLSLLAFPAAVAALLTTEVIREWISNSNKKFETFPRAPHTAAPQLPIIWKRFSRTKWISLCLTPEWMEQRRQPTELGRQIETKSKKMPKKISSPPHQPPEGVFSITGNGNRIVKFDLRVIGSITEGAKMQRKTCEMRFSSLFFYWGEMWNFFFGVLAANFSIPANFREFSISLFFRSNEK